MGLSLQWMAVSLLLIGAPFEALGRRRRIKQRGQTKIAYMGCFVDNPKRILIEKFFHSRSLTIEKCCDFCSKAGYTYGGVEHSTGCYCGDQLKRRIRKGDGECNMRCSGNKKQMCGGYWRMSVFAFRHNGKGNVKPDRPHNYCRKHSDCNRHGTCEGNECRCRHGYFGDGVHTCDKMCECSASGDPHYRTYDGQLIHFQGICKYTMTKLKDQKDPCAFNIEVKNEHRGHKTTVSYTRLVDIKLGKDVIRLHQQRKTFVNGEEIALPYHGRGYKIFKSGYNVRVETKCKVYVEWNGNHVVSISVPPKFKNKMTGICGDCNGKKDDLKTKYGKDVSKEHGGDIKMIDSYSVKDDSDKPHKHCKESEPPSPCSAALRKKSMDPHVCGYIHPSLKKRSPFFDCVRKHKDLANQMFYDCQFDYCFYILNPVNIMEVICDSVAAFADECEMRGFPAAWRSDTFCPLPCEENMKYSTTVSGCPASCADLDSERKCHLPDSEGCECIPGFVLSNNKCVPKSECGCKAKNGKYYPIGHKYTKPDCSVTFECKLVRRRPKIVTLNRNLRCPKDAHCVFIHGEYACKCQKEGYIFDGDVCKKDIFHGYCDTDSECDANGNCYHHKCRCNKGYIGDGFNSCTKMCTCEATGDPHYRTYDRQLIHFQGICKYTLTKSTIQHDPCAFNIEVKNEHIGRKRTVAYTRLVDVKVYHDTVRLHNKFVTFVNGVRVKLPYHSKKGYDVFRSGLNVRLETKCNVYVEWNGLHSVSVSVPDKYAGKMIGICGDCNGKTDDLKTKGGKDVSKQKNAFVTVGESYSVKDDSDQPHEHCKAGAPPAPCTAKLHHEAQQLDVCGYINPATKDKSPFKACITKYPKLAKQMFEDCVYDFCFYAGKTDVVAKTICNSIAGFAEQCSLRGLTAKWRSKDFCPIKCSPNMEYSTFVSGCPATCGNFDAEKHCKMPSTEGCKCVDGHVLSDNKCIPKSKCGCNDRDGKYYPLGYSFTTKDCSTTIQCMIVKEIPALVTIRKSKDCPKHSTCMLSDGEYACKCNKGYRYEGDICVGLSKNIARGKKAYQSSSYMNHYPAGNAVNDVETDFSSTNYEDRPYWYVDLGAVHPIDNVVIITRFDCCGDKIHDLMVTLGADLKHLKTCGGYSGPGSNHQKIRLLCGPKTTGRYVKVAITTGRKNVLQLAEVQVYS